MAEKETKVAVVAIEVPWSNIECLGIFDSFDEANKAAQEHTDHHFSITGEEAEYTFEPLNTFGSTSGVDSDWNEGYEYLFLEAPFEGCYVRVEDEKTDDYEIRGPYHDEEEANLDLFGPRARKKFVCVAGSFSMGFYPVEKGGKRYTYLPIYNSKKE